MLRSVAGAYPDTELIALEARAERAGLALACAFSSSAEFDAALIAQRRAAGIYGLRRRRRQALAASIGVAAALLSIAHFIG
jgi:hypothetical protein